MRNPEKNPVLTVMSYNIQGHGALFSKGYLAGVSRVIRHAAPDLVGLQEVHRGTWAARFRDQVEELAEATGLTACFGRSLETRTGEYGNAVLTRGPILEQELVTLPGEAERRSLLRCRVEHGDHPLDFFVTHFAAWGPITRGIRRRQARFVAERLNAAEGDYVLVGDFNASPAAPELDSLCAAEEIQLCGERHAVTHRVLRQRIDYILAHPDWHSLSSSVVRSGPSDHFPIVARLARKARIGQRLQREAQGLATAASSR